MIHPIITITILFFINKVYRYCGRIKCFNHPGNVSKLSFSARDRWLSLFHLYAFLLLVEVFLYSDLVELERRVYNLFSALPYILQELISSDRKIANQYFIKPFIHSQKTTGRDKEK